MREAPRSRLGTLHPLWRQDAPYAGAAARGQAVDLSRLSSVQVEALAKAGFIDPVMRDSKAEVAEGVGRLLNWPPDRQGLMPTVSDGGARRASLSSHGLTDCEVISMPRIACFELCDKLPGLWQTR